MKITITQHWAEFISALGVILWGLMFTNPYYNAFGVGPFREMAFHATQLQWGMIAIAFGLVAMAGLFTGHVFTRRLGMLLVFSFRFFCFLFVGMASHFYASGLPDYLLWCVLAIVAFVQVGRE